MAMMIMNYCEWSYSADGLVLDDDGDNVDDTTQHNTSQAKPISPKYVETQENKYLNIKT